MIAENEQFFQNHPDAEVQRRGMELIGIIDCFQRAYFCRLSSRRARKFICDERPLSATRTVQRDLILRTLEETKGNIKRTAKITGIGRETIYARMRACGISEVTEE